MRNPQIFISLDVMVASDWLIWLYSLTLKKRVLNLFKNPIYAQIRANLLTIEINGYIFLWKHYKPHIIIYFCINYVIAYFSSLSVCVVSECAEPGGLSANPGRRLCCVIGDWPTIG